MRRIVAALVDYHDASFRKNYNSNMKEVIKNIDEIQISKKGGLFDINIKYAYGVIRSGRQSGNDSRTSRQFSTDSDFSVTSMGGHGSGRFVRPPRISREQERTSTERSNPTRENRATSRDRVVPDASTSETTRPVESSPAPAAPPKPMYEPGEVRLIAQNVDDIMEIFLDDAKVAECRWAGTGCGAGWKGVLKDRHKVRFKLTNVPYTGFCMTQPCGKWSADMLVMVEDKKIWSNGVFGRENDAGVKYDVTLTCDFTKGLCIE
ncbi:hypothetical protein amb1719 [Paramagnetospirillum magneticum AMB-1]|uniref:Uncharacterized protein n=2 Tax=Paramagnetospirillum magneticum TaxID=84159 RepID=Q2W6K2_PARM1|nr:hypothetical protein amb1719 [Paramagnetospirillum magneticum AMB-1]